MSESPRIRPATFGDEKSLAAMEYDGWSTLYAVHPRPDSPDQPFFSDRTSPEHLLVAEADDGRVAGYVRVVRVTPLAAHAHVRQIQGLLVADWARGRGVARALIRAACERARAQGARRLTLRVLGHNAPARALYASEGFVVEGVQREELLLDGAYVDDVLMARSLL